MDFSAVETVVELVREGGRVGGELGVGPFRRDSAHCRRVQLLSHLLEEIRDSQLFSSLDVKVDSSGGGSSSSTSGDVSCLSALQGVAASQQVISDARSVNNASPKAAIKKMDMQASREFLAELKVLMHVHLLNMKMLGYSAGDGTSTDSWDLVMWSTAIFLLKFLLNCVHAQKHSLWMVAHLAASRATYLSLLVV